MKAHAVLSALGRDRLEVADDLSAVLAQRGIDIEESRMTVLGGQSCMVMRVCGEPDRIDDLERALSELGASLGFHLELKALDAPTPAPRVEQYWIETFSPVASGIGAVAAVLKGHDVNILDLETEAGHEPFSSSVTLRTKARVTIPRSCAFTRLRAELRELEVKRDLDIVVKPVFPRAEQ